MGVLGRHANLSMRPGHYVKISMYNKFRKIKIWHDFQFISSFTRKKLAVNSEQFIDLSNIEFKSKFCGVKMSKRAGKYF